MRTVLKAFGAGAVVATAVMVSAVAASAAPPTEGPYDVSGTYTVDDFCDFPIEVTYHNVGVNRDFHNSELDGTGVVRTAATGQDTFAANGNTLIGERYRGTATFKFVDFELVEFTYVGMLEKVRLPDGTIFMAAGRVDLLLREEAFVFYPDHGVAKNQDAFCAALSA